MATYKVQVKYHGILTKTVEGDNEEQAKERALRDFRYSGGYPYGVQSEVLGCEKISEQRRDLALFEQAIAREKAQAKEYHKEGERDMGKMHTQDARDLQKVLTQYKRGNYKKAMELAWHMDTAAREGIPDCCWRIMEQACELP